MGTSRMLEQTRLEREGYENYPGRFQPNMTSRVPMYLQPMVDMASHQVKAPRIPSTSSSVSLYRSTTSWERTRRLPRDPSQSSRGGTSLSE